MILGLLSVEARIAPPVFAATSQFHGVNWADPDDNFITGPNIPVGLVQTDSYATTYSKATKILKGFQGLGAITVRFGIHAAITSSSWWNSYTAAFDAATALGLNVIICPWLQGGIIRDSTASYQMWSTVVSKYGRSGSFYFDIMNEPHGMTAAVLTGTLLSIHIYGMFGDSHTTEQAWISDFKTRLCGYSSRAVLTEFGVPMNTGVNYDGARDGRNDLSCLYGITDTVRALGLGSVLWTGVKQAAQTSGPGPCENMSCAITSLNSNGTVSTATGR